jgi:hypothetical protein
MRHMLVPKDLIRATWFFINYFVKMTGELGYRIVRVDWATILGFHNSSTCRKDPASLELTRLVPPGTSLSRRFRLLASPHSSFCQGKNRRSRIFCN